VLTLMTGLMSDQSRC